MAATVVVAGGPQPALAATLRPAVNYPAGDRPDVVGIAEVTGDGRADLVVADIGSRKVSILAGRGDGSCASPVSYPVGMEPSALAVGDLNGDGHSDVAVAASDSSGDRGVQVQPRGSVGCVELEDHGEPRRRTRGEPARR